jgi:hypothetical protein
VLLGESQVPGEELSHIVSLRIVRSDDELAHRRILPDFPRCSGASV